MVGVNFYKKSKFKQISEHTLDDDLRHKTRKSQCKTIRTQERAANLPRCHIATQRLLNMMADVEFQLDLPVCRYPLNNFTGELP
jgi:hypothetical protein